MSRGVHVPGWSGLRHIQTLANIRKQAHIQSNPSIGTSYPTHYSPLGLTKLVLIIYISKRQKKKINTKQPQDWLNFMETPAHIHPKPGMSRMHQAQPVPFCQSAFHFLFRFVSLIWTNQSLN